MKKMSKSRQGGRYEGKRGHGKGFKRCPVALGEELEVEITELSPKGEGIARNQGFVIYVADVKPGDRAKIKITRITGIAANAHVVK
jgi:predicted RNA-binding protein with TRAM domain